MLAILCLVSVTGIFSNAYVQRTPQSSCGWSGGTVYLSQTLTADNIACYGTEWYFVNAYLGSSSNIIQTFGLGSNGGNLSLQQINTNTIVTSNQGSSTENATFYYSSYGTVPTEVMVGNSITIPKSAYFTTYSTWFSTTGNNAYWNSTGDYLEVKTTVSNALLTWWLSFVEVSVTVSYTAVGTLGGLFASNPTFLYIHDGVVITGTLLATTVTYQVDNNTVVVPQNTWYDNGHVYSVTPTSNLITGTTTQIYAYAIGSAGNQTTLCNSAEVSSTYWNTTILWQNGCVAPAIVWTFADVVTLPGFYAFLVAFIDVPILLKSKNFLLAMTVGLIVGGALVSATGILSQPIELLIWLGVVTSTAFIFVRLYQGRSTT